MNIQPLGALNQTVAPVSDTPAAGGVRAPQQNAKEAGLAKNAKDTASAKNAESPESTRSDGKPSSLEQIKEAAEKLNKFVQPYANELKFSVDDDTGIGVVKVIDLASKEVIRQIPSEEVLAIAKSVEKLQGLLVKQIV